MKSDKMFRYLSVIYVNDIFGLNWQIITSISDHNSGREYKLIPSVNVLVCVCLFVSIQSQILIRQHLLAS